MDINIKTLPADNRVFPFIATIGRNEIFLTKESALFLRDRLTEALEKVK